MKKLYLSVVPLLFHFFLSAQSEITVAPGTDLYLPAGTVFSSGGLVLTTSADLTLNGVAVTKSTTITHFTLNNYVSRVYQFSNTTSPFSGTIRFNYDDAELNGLNEASLTVNIHTGSSWLPVNSTTNDVTNNYVFTNAIVNRSLNEITLSDAFSTLPLKWGSVTAWRQLQTIKVNWTTRQESNIAYYTVERSEDGRNWSVVADHLPAGNTSGLQQYSATDNDYQTSRLYYRIRQTGMDGKVSYSMVAVVAARDEVTKMILYPNPVISVFYISNIPAGDINEVRLYSNNGLLLKTWTSAQTSYNIQSVPAGVYHVNVEMKDGSHHYNKISK